MTSSQSSCSVIIAKINRLKELCKSKSVTQLLQTVEELTSELKGVNFFNEEQLLQIESECVDLWNFTVEAKESASIPLFIISNLRYAALFVCYIICGENTCENMKRIIRHLTMAQKLGQSWLDCSETQIVRARKMKLLAQELFTRIQYLNERGKGETIPKEKMKAYQIRNLILNLNLAIHEKDHENCKESLAMLYGIVSTVQSHQETQSLIITCYNEAMKHNEDTETRDLESVTFWLLYSSKFCHYSKFIDKKTKTQIMRHLASAYLEMGDQEKTIAAYQICQEANKENRCIPGLYLMLRISLAMKRDGKDTANILSSLVLHENITWEVMNSALQILFKTFDDFALDERQQITTSITKLLETRFSGDTAVDTELKIIQLRFLVASELGDQAYELIKSRVLSNDELVRNIKGDIEKLKSLQMLIWKQADVFTKTGNDGEAMKWFEASLFLYQNVARDDNLGKLLRNLTRCYISTGHVAKAVCVAKEAVDLQPDCLPGRILLYQVYLLNNDDNEALSELNRLMKLMSTPSSMSSTDVQKYLAQATQIALETNQHMTVAMSALRQLIEVISESSTALSCLRCLIRENYSQIETGSDAPIKHSTVISILEDMQKGFDILKNSTFEPSETDVEFFRDITWNIGVLTSKQNLHKLALKAFQFSFKFCDMKKSSAEVLVQRFKSLYMTASMTTKIAQSNSEEKKALYFQVLDIVLDCKLMTSELATSTQSNMSAYHRGLFILELEARLCLGGDGLRQMIDQLAESSDLSWTLCQDVANFLFTRTSVDQTLILALCEQTLIVGLDKAMLQNAHQAVLKFYCLLIELHLKRFSSSPSDQGNRSLEFSQQLLIYLTEHQLDPDAHSTSLRFVISELWNQGVQLFNEDKAALAHRYCLEARKLLPRMPVLKTQFEKQMNDFIEILSEE